MLAGHSHTKAGWVHVLVCFTTQVCLLYLCWGAHLESAVHRALKCVLHGFLFWWSVFNYCLGCGHHLEAFSLEKSCKLGKDEVWEALQLLWGRGRVGVTAIALFCKLLSQIFWSLCGNRRTVCYHLPFLLCVVAKRALWLSNLVQINCLKHHKCQAC